MLAFNKLQNRVIVELTILSVTVIGPYFGISFTTPNGSELF